MENEKGEAGDNLNSFIDLPGFQPCRKEDFHNFYD